jgi:hypothetical protein
MSAAIAIVISCSVGVRASPGPPKQSVPSCLCIFDVDRTLTGKQDDTSACPDNVVMGGIADVAYGGGNLTLSSGLLGLASTFCSRCFIGAVSAGSASEGVSSEEDILVARLNASGHLPTSTWCSYKATTPLVTHKWDGTKQDAVAPIVAWYAQHAGARIDDRDVYFFDDRDSNVSPFKKSRYNAAQISCATRDKGGSVGLCGVTVSEIVPVKGVRLCSNASARVP